MNGFEVLGDLAPADDDAAAVIGGGIPVSIHLGTPVLIGQSVNTTESGPIISGTANATV
jgi:hypothetical protein